ncbi:hypothetical protein EGT51_11490 [Levilactobacillus suantsaiihabitans]|uniref:Uncharacterized protein n=1 Tax=Levilactobacillus suantsaiihabitans TaxID=2487722 RepID=A0A4Z0J5C6_9LACO|nr:hypothetical protein EGT51_11490 [Levilactobacillus suantsaiihabitans]
MEPAVSAVLAEVLSQPTARDDLRDWRVLPGFQARQKTAPQAGAVPQSRSHPNLTQAPGFINFRCQNTVTSAISALFFLFNFQAFI